MKIQATKLWFATLVTVSLASFYPIHQILADGYGSSNDKAKLQREHAMTHRVDAKYEDSKSPNPTKVEIEHYSPSVKEAKKQVNNAIRHSGIEEPKKQLTVKHQEPEDSLATTQKKKLQREHAMTRRVDAEFGDFRSPNPTKVEIEHYSPAVKEAKKGVNQEIKRRRRE